MTEMPAKTPRPMGRTDNFLPGSSNAPVDAAEELPPLAAVPVAPGVDDVPDEEVLFVVGVVVEDDVDAVGAGVLVTVDRPLTTKPSPVEGAVVEEVEVEVEEVVVVVGVGVIVGATVGEVVVAVRVGVIAGERVAVVRVGVVIVGELVVPLTELAPVVVGRPEVAVNVPGIVDVTAPETAEVVAHAVAPGVQVAIVQLSTSCTAGFPLLSVVGVRVTTQVSTNGPASVRVV